MTSSNRFQVDPDRVVLGLVIVALDRGKDRKQEGSPSSCCHYGGERWLRGNLPHQGVMGYGFPLDLSLKFIPMKCCIRYWIDE
jgi:hypothetical protein